MDFTSHYSREHGEYNGIGLEEILAMHDIIFFGREQLDRVYNVSYIIMLVDEIH